jgi:hypothetical protein
MENNIKLTVNNYVFDRNTFLPSNVLFSNEYIKQTERALSGTLYTDSDGKKQKMQVIFEFLNIEQFDLVKSIFDDSKADGVNVKYLTTDNYFMVDDITFEPWMYDGDNLCWRNIVIDLLEI